MNNQRQQVKKLKDPDYPVHTLLHSIINGIRTRPDTLQAKIETHPTPLRAGMNGVSRPMQSGRKSLEISSNGTRFATISLTVQPIIVSMRTPPRAEKGEHMLSFFNIFLENNNRVPTYTNFIRGTWLQPEDAEVGAHLVCGGTTRDFFYEPTILDRVTGAMEIAHNEIFGPVMPVISVTSIEEAITMANDSEYGLDSCVFTSDIDTALQTAAHLHDGTVSVNAVPAHGVGRFPFGGNIKSGMGREGLKYSVDELSQLHTIVLRQPQQITG